MAAVVLKQAFRFAAVALLLLGAVELVTFQLPRETTSHPWAFRALLQAGLVAGVALLGFVGACIGFGLAPASRAAGRGRVTILGVVFAIATFFALPAVLAALGLIATVAACLLLAAAVAYIGARLP
jgi:hypothetical protein